MFQQFACTINTTSSEYETEDRGSIFFSENEDKKRTAFRLRFLNEMRPLFRIRAGTYGQKIPKTSKSVVVL